MGEATPVGTLLLCALKMVVKYTWDELSVCAKLCAV